jgi:multisubunit Na+/H+ antiporter MnhE subunit
MRRFLLALVLLTLVYVLALESFAPLDVLTGALLAVALLAGFRRLTASGQVAETRIAQPSLLRRIIAFVPFALVVLWDVLEGTWVMVRIVLHIHPLDPYGIVEVPIGERTPSGVAVTTLVTTLSPGSFLVDVDTERQVMLFHNIDAHDPEAIRARHEYIYQRYQRHVFP